MKNDIHVICYFIRSKHLRRTLDILAESLTVNIVFCLLTDVQEISG